ncbi:hypothetical protein ABFX02_03G011900 [Erythranthe guttata]
MAAASSAEATPPWQELPREITAAILYKLGPFEILTTAVKVCTAWRSVCQDPSMWRRVDMRSTNGGWERPFKTEPMCRRAVDLSQGQLIDLSIEHFATDDLLLYISQRSSQLKRLQLINSLHMFRNSLIGAIKNFPLLEELHLEFTDVSRKTIETIGESCPLLKSFKLNTDWQKYTVSDAEALAISKSMHGLVHLQLISNRMTDKGLNAILEGCPNLESLDLRRCFKVRLWGNLRNLCSERIKDLKLPRDPIDDCRFGTHEVYNDDEYGTWDDDIYDDETSEDDVYDDESSDDFCGGCCCGDDDMDLVSDVALDDDDDSMEYSGDEYDDESEVSF